MNIAVYCSARTGIDPVHIEDARALGHWIGSNGHTLVYGGLSLGLMDTVARATSEAGGKVIGVVPQSRVEFQNEGNTVKIAVTNLHERKAIMEENADAFVALAGGYGTLDEVMSALASMTFFREPKPLMLLNRDGLYTPLIDMLRNMADLRLVNPAVTEGILLPTNPDELTGALAAIAANAK